MSESAAPSPDTETTDQDRSWLVEWWLGLDSGWQATVLGVAGVACSFAVRVL